MTSADTAIQGCVHRGIQAIRSFDTRIENRITQFTGRNRLLSIIAGTIYPPHLVHLIISRVEEFRTADDNERSIILLEEAIDVGLLIITSDVTRTLVRHYFSPNSTYPTLTS